MIGSVSSNSIVPEPPFLRPQAHGDGRDQQQEHPWDEGEERVQVGLAAVEELPEVEGQRALQHQEDDDEHRGDRGGEIGPKLRPATTR